MGWTESIRDALGYIEEHLTEELTIEEISRQVHFSPYYFQKGFALLCDFTVSDYIRCRRLALAASELVATDRKIIEIALKYGYQSPDSFTKAFTRFHGCTPSEARKGNPVKAFAPLSIKFQLTGGATMEYKMMEKEAFTVVGLQKEFAYEEATQKVPEFWKEYVKSPVAKTVAPVFGVNSDEKMKGDRFRYLIGDVEQGQVLPADCTKQEIPAFTWAIFPCKGPMPTKIQEVNRQIYEEWLPNSRDYEIAAGYCIEYYEDPSQYPLGTHDAAYYAEIWLPVKKKHNSIM